MAKNKSKFKEAPTYEREDRNIFIAVLTIGFVCSCAGGYHIFRDWGGDEISRYFFGVGTAVASMAVTFIPTQLARPQGEAFDGGTPQGIITIMAALVIVADTAVISHGVYSIWTSSSNIAPRTEWIVGISAIYAIAAFGVRSSMYAVTEEHREIIEAYEIQQAEREAAVAIAQAAAIADRARKDERNARDAARKAAKLAEAEAEAKPKRGRPKGSKNKPKAADTSNVARFPG